MKEKLKLTIKVLKDCKQDVVEIAVFLLLAIILLALMYKAGDTNETQQIITTMSTTNTTTITTTTTKTTATFDDKEHEVENKQSKGTVEKVELTEVQEIEPVEDYDEDNVDSSYIGAFRLTAYCGDSCCCGEWAGSPTASGTYPRAYRTVAVDTNIIPLGTHLLINGNEYVAEDTGSAVKGNVIDIYFDSHSEAEDFGVQYAEVYIIE